jgi:hypothetical protein
VGSSLDRDAPPVPADALNRITAKMLHRDHASGQFFPAPVSAPSWTAENPMPGPPAPARSIHMPG